MVDGGSIDSVLTGGAREKLAVVERALTTAGPPSTAAALKSAALDARRILDDTNAALGGGPGGSGGADVAACLARALRLVEPVVRDTGVQLVLEGQSARLVAAVDETALLRLLAMLARDALERAAPAGLLTISAGASLERLWVAFASRPPGGTGRMPGAEASAEARAFASKLGAALDVERHADGSGAVRLQLRGAAPAGGKAPIAKLRLSPAGRPDVAPLAPESPARAAGAGEGSCTVVATRAPSAADRILDAVTAHASAALEGFFAVPSPRRVLVVDDEQAILGLFAAALPTIGIDLEVATDADAARALMQPGRYSLAILDKNLPGHSGLELLQDLRRIDPHLGAVLVTGYTSAHSVSSALELDVYDYIDKPFPDIFVLLSRIELALQRHAMHTRVARLAEKLTGISEVVSDSNAATDLRLARVRRLLEPTPEPVRIAALAPAAVSEYFTDPLAPLSGAIVERFASAAALRLRLGTPARADLVVVDPASWVEPLSTLMALCRAVDGAVPQVCVVTRDESLSPALEALAAGVADYLLVGDATPDQVRRRIQHAVQRLRLHRRDRAILLDLLSVDLDRLGPPESHDAPSADELARFEPDVGSDGGAS